MLVLNKEIPLGKGPCCGPLDSLELKLDLKIEKNDLLIIGIFACTFFDKAKKHPCMNEQIVSSLFSLYYNSVI